MISLVITSFKEPHLVGKAIDSLISQDINDPYELIVSAPDKETQKVVKEYARKFKQIKLFKDPGKGKTYALNLLIPRLRGDIIILMDGDVYTSKNSIKLIINTFKDKKVGCITGRPVSLNSRDNIFGYWSHLLCNAAHILRMKRAKKNLFLECSGYLWAFKKEAISKIKKIPRETAEDTIVPILIYQKGFKIKYILDAEVYVRYPSNLKDFIEQKKRTAKAHETLSIFADLNSVPRMKSFKNELLGCLDVLKYPQSIKELFWTFLLFPVRLYIWLAAFFQRYIKKELKVDGWKQIESTK